MTMADARHLALLRRSVGEWNAWRRATPMVRPNLRGADLTEADLRGANLSRVNLSWADLSLADLTEADLRGADLYDANLGGATLSRARLTEADLSRAYLREANLTGADLRGATLIGADLWAAYLPGAALAEADLTLAHLDRAHFYGAHLERANLREADLTEADLSRANLTEADLTGADLTRAILTETDLSNATLNGCRVYGISAWNVHLDDAIQTNLRITPDDEAEITVDNLEVAQFLFLILHNETIRELIEGFSGRIVLILGRFTPERAAIRETLRDVARQHQPPYAPVLFDIEAASERNAPEMVGMLARLARFIVADLTNLSDPATARQVFAAITPHAHAPVMPIIVEGAPPDLPDSLLGEYRDTPSVGDLYRYRNPDDLAATLRTALLAPADSAHAPHTEPFIESPSERETESLTEPLIDLEPGAEVAEEA
jgi:uncharacterized protein YjbI with pentapeptide repeats